MYIESFSYVDYNANPRGTSTGDCQTRAIATAFDMSWDKVRRILRKEKNPYNSDHYRGISHLSRVLVDEFKCKQIPIPEDEYTNGKYLTVGDFCDGMGANGTYLIFCSSKGDEHYADHLVCTINGVVYDTWDSSKARVTDIYQPTSNYRTEGFSDISDIPDNIYKIAKAYREEFATQLSGSVFLNKLIDVIPEVHMETVECKFGLKYLDYDKIHGFNFVIEVKPLITIKEPIYYIYDQSKRFNIAFSDTDMTEYAYASKESKVADMLDSWYDAILNTIHTMYDAEKNLSGGMKNPPESKKLLEAYKGIPSDLREHVIDMGTLLGYTCAIVQLDAKMHIMAMCKKPSDLGKNIEIIYHYDYDYWNDYHNPTMNITPYGFLWRRLMSRGFYYDDKREFREFLDTYNEYLEQDYEPKHGLDYFFSSWNVPEFLE